MAVLGGGRFLMSEAPLQPDALPTNYFTFLPCLSILP